MWALVMGVWFAVASCAGDAARVALPGKVGAAGELVVVADVDVWSGAAGDTLQAVMAQPYPVLPQYEPLMDVVHLEPELFDRFWKPHRNILVLEVADRIDTQEPNFTFYRNKYSRGQVYMGGQGALSRGVGRGRRVARRRDGQPVARRGGQALRRHRGAVPQRGDRPRGRREVGPSGFVAQGRARGQKDGGVFGGWTAS